MIRVKVKGRSNSLIRIRSHIDIMACVLSEAVTEKAKTAIMYRCNLSHRQLQAYLKLLSGMEMLKQVSRSGSRNRIFFKTSAKGREFLDAYRKLKALMT